MNYIYELEIIKSKLLNKQITYLEAKILSEPILIKMNEKGLIISKKYNQKHRKITFSSFMR